MSDNMTNSNFKRNIEKVDDIDVSKLLASLLDYKWLIISVTSMFTVMGIIYSILATPIYQADALIQVEQKSAGSILGDISEMMPNSQPASAAEIELIKSRMVIGKTVDDLDLTTVVSQKHFPIVGAGLSRLLGYSAGELNLSKFDVPNTLLKKDLSIEILNKESYRLSYDGKDIINGKVGQYYNVGGVSILITNINADSGSVFYIKKLPRLTAIKNILDDFDVVDKGKDTGVLALTYNHESPVLTQKILDRITKNYLLQNVERKSEEAGKSLSFLKERLPEVRTTLNSAENKLNSFRQDNESVDLSLEAKSVLDTMVQLESQLNELTFKESEISKLYTKEHPAYRALLEKRKTLEDEKKKLNTKIGDLPKTQQQILSLTRDVQAGQEIYMQMLNKEQELNITKASTVGNVRIVDGSEYIAEPVKPKKLIIIVLSTFLGFIVAVCYSLTRAALRKGVESAEQIETLGINVYASIPLSEWQKSKDKEFNIKSKSKSKTNYQGNQLLAVGNPIDLSIEAIRSLRTSLHFAMIEAKNNILMISGSSPAIGKSFVGANLAAVIAQAGQRILFIDADMRRGYAHLQLNAKAEQGLSDVLSGQITFEDAIKKTELACLDFISRGQIPPNPSELLMSERLSAFMTWASENYDIVLLDTPPILAVTDAGIIGHHVGTSLLVARFEVNTLKEIEISIKRFEQNGINVKGIILNAVVKKASNYYDYYNYHYKNA
ncbi:tyrosine-protein kinase Wzc [Serratia fonticola]|uniref:tyrosine-protein kinase Wzc n=1 Tax=Serratia fonticola TaxID=47917 RepID=UPI000BA2B10A|nr:tyrosine-protein kinase Wzc [Serratia fonticola]MBP1035278.1 tyrosine-protein kinase Wzc [Serratia fonticola]PAA95939.1 tyrosine-protein kinase [Serratia fonticola]